MCDLSEDQRRQLDVTLASDPSLAAGIEPLLDGECGFAARDLWLSCLARRLAAGKPMRGALLPALADAVRLAQGGGATTPRQPLPAPDRGWAT